MPITNEKKELDQIYAVRYFIINFLSFFLVISSSLFPDLNIIRY